MDSSKKREEFAISIRKKHTNAKIESMRALLSNPTEQNIDNHEQLLVKIIQGEEILQKNLRALKILSWKPNTAKDLHDAGIHRILCEKLVKNQENMKSDTFKEIISILINLCVYTDLDISSQTMQVIASNFSNYERQMVCFWFIANIIYQKSVFSTMVAEELVGKCGVLDFLEKRIQDKFQNSGDIYIFNFFICSFLVVSSSFTYPEMKRIIALIEQIHQFQQQKDQNLYFFSEALIDHVPHMAANNYAIFQSKLIDEFHLLCKKKKTKFVRNYLKVFVGLTSCDSNAYEKMLTNGVFTDLDFCLENRFPQIKGLCADIGCNLLDNFSNKVDTDGIGFFAELSTAFVGFQKHPLEVQVKLLKFSFRYYKITAENKIGKQEKINFIDEILNGKILDALGSIILSSNGQFELLALSLGLLSVLIDCDEQQRLTKKCLQQKIPNYVDQLQTLNPELKQHIQMFLTRFRSSDMI